MMNKRYSDKSMIVTDNGHVVGAKTNIADVAQQWILEATGKEETYYIKNAKTGAYLGELKNNVQIAASETFDGAKGYKAIFMGPGIWAMQCQDGDKKSLNYNNWEGANKVLGWSHDGDDGSWWFLTAVALNDVESISLSEMVKTLIEGEAFTLTATITPANATDRRVVWSSSDSLVATVDPSGKVTAVSSGTAAITASCGGKSSSCAVTVERPLGITSLSELGNGVIYHISQPHHSSGATSWAVQTGGMALKSNADLSINVDRTDICQQFAFVSNDGGSTRYLYHVAESKFVNKDGSLGIKPMDAISLKSGAYSNTFVAYFDESHYVNVGGSRQMIIDDWKTSDGGNSCIILPVGEFDVTAALKAFVVEVTSITLSDSQVNLVEGDSLLLVATVIPEDATDKRIVWSSSDPLVATVDTLGKVTAVLPGTATITASSGTVSSSCDVVVSRKYIPVEEVVLSDSLVSLIEGDSLLLFATVTPDDATDKRIVWSSSNPIMLEFSPMMCPIYF